MRQNHKIVFSLTIILLILPLDSRSQVFDGYLNIESEKAVIIHGMEVDKENNIYLIGYLEDSADFQPGLKTSIAYASSINISNKIDPFLASYNKSSDLRWVHVFPEADPTRNSDFGIDDSSNIIASFYRFFLDPPTDYDPGPDTSFHHGDFVMARYSSEGKFIWAYGPSIISGSWMRACATNPNGDFYILGIAGFPLVGDFDPGPDTITITTSNYDSQFLAKYGADNSFEWVNTLNLNRRLTFLSIEGAKKNGFAYMGTFSDTLDFDFGPGTFVLTGANQYADYFIARHDSLAQIKWANRIQSKRKPPIIFPFFPHNFIIQRHKHFPYHSYRPKMIFNEQDELYMGISFQDTIDIFPDQAGGDYYNSGSLDILLCKLDTSGNYLWSKHIANNGEASLQDMYVDHQGNLLITGNFSDSLDIDPSPAVHKLYALGRTDIFFAKFDSLGNFIWGHAINGSGELAAAGIRIDQEGTVVIAGVFDDSMDVDIDPVSSVWVKSKSVRFNNVFVPDGFVARYRQCPEPIITYQVQDTSLCKEDSFRMGIAVSDSGLSYQWFFNGSAIPGATDSTWSISSVQLPDSGYYHCEVSLGCPYAEGPIIRSSDTLLLKVEDHTRVVSQPTDFVGCAGDSLSFELTAQGAALNYQWFQNNIPIPGADTAVFPISNITPFDTGLYYCEIMGVCGPSVISNTVSLSLQNSPSLLQQPADTLLCPGEDARFNLMASGDGLQYQWYFNGQALGSNQPDLNISAATPADSGWYYCMVSGSCDPTIRTDSVRLDLRAAPAVQSSPHSLLRMRGDTARFSVSATGDGLSYQWYKDNNPLANNARITGSQSTMLEIRNLVFTDSGSYHCEVSGVCLPPANSDPAQLQIGGVSIDDEIVSLLKVYPNPSTGIFQVEGPAGRRIGLRVFDDRGVEIGRDLCNTSVRLDLSAQPKGTYLLVADDGSRIVLIRQ